MSELTPPMVGECATWLSIVSQLFSNRMNILLEPHGLTLGQFSILNHIVRSPIEDGHRISDISAAVEVKQPAVTKAVAKFQNMRLVDVIESTSDKRSKFVKPKPEAVALLGSIYKDIGPDLFNSFSAVKTGNISQFTQQLKELGTYIDKNRV